MRNISKVAPAWWDYTTLDGKLLDEAASLTEKDILNLARQGFAIGSSTPSNHSLKLTEITACFFARAT
jgi:hypothetical protein